MHDTGSCLRDLTDAFLEHNGTFVSPCEFLSEKSLHRLLIRNYLNSVLHFEKKDIRTSESVNFNDSLLVEMTVAYAIAKMHPYFGLQLKSIIILFSLFRLGCDWQSWIWITER